ncbi:MAG: cation transporter [Raineya sp.]|jgi:copper chaperone CopZ|nr:cation transporter [Raineya sp.]
MEHVIQVENIKCGGCINSIKKALSSLLGVENVQVEKETETVTVVGVDTIRNNLVEKLAQLGYPEKGNNNLLHKAKSFVSCAVGRITKED